MRKDLVEVVCTYLKLKTEGFKEDGFYNSDIGDLVLPVMVDVLRIPIVVVTGYQHFPVFNISPSMTTSLTNEITYLAYNSVFMHYDFLYEQNGENTKPTQTSCQCGINDKKAKHPLMHDNNI